MEAVDMVRRCAYRPRFHAASAGPEGRAAKRVAVFMQVANVLNANYRVKIETWKL